MNELIRKADQQKYKAAFDQHPFENMPAIVSWLLYQAKQMATQKNTKPTLFKDAASSSEINSKLVAGDTFFFELLKDRPLFPFPGVNGKSHPLTDAVGAIYESLWNLPAANNNSRVDDIMLVQYIESKLGCAVAREPRLSKPKFWIKLVERFERSSSFYDGLLNNLPRTIIERFQADLEFPTDKNNVLHQIFYFDKRVGNKDFHIAYAQQMVKLENGSPWKLIKTLNSRAEYGHFSPEWSFKRDLALRLPTKNWVIWTDRLYWPFTQAISFSGVRDLARMEEFLDELVKAAKNLTTPYPNLTLIALNHYFHRLIHEITKNLYDASTNTSPGRADVKLPIQATATCQFDEWITSGRKNSLTKVFDAIFADPDLLTPPFLRGVFDWVADQDQGTWSLSPQGKKTAPDIKDLYDAFLGKIKNDAHLRSDLLTAIQSDELTWAKVELLVSLYVQDETDMPLRSNIVDKILDWLQSKTFGWNHGLGYNDVVMNQACHLAYLIYRGPDSELIINTIIENYRYWHEGWPTKLPRTTSQHKELYTIITGIFVCYNYLDDEDRAIGKRLFDRYLWLVLDQYRQATRGDRKFYCLAIRLLIHIHIKFDMPDFPLFMNQILKLVDNVEEILQIASDWIETANFLKSPLDHTIVNAMLSRINADFWIIQAEIKATGNLSPFRIYEKMHSNITSAFRPSSP